MMTPIAGWLPDADPVTPGVLTDCMHVVSTPAGYAGAPSAVQTTVASLGTDCRGAVVASDLIGTRRVFAGTQTKINLLSGNAWLDKSKSGGYVGSSESRWSFAQFGDTTMASNLSDAMQSSVAGAVFADVPNAPKAKIIVSQASNFVLAFYTNDPTYGVSADRWWCCAQSDQTNWAPNVATGANTGRLISMMGAINAALVLGDYVVAYKTRGIYLGSFVGSPVGFQWNLIPGGPAGCIGQDAVCDIGGAHFIVGEDSFWMFDGTRPAPIGQGEARQWFYGNSNPSWRYRTQATYDRLNNLVRINYASAASTGLLDSTIVYNTVTKQWSRDDHNTSAAIQYIAPGTTIDGMNSYAATIDALPAVPVDSPFWKTGGQSPSFFDWGGQLYSLNGTTGPSYIVTGDVGDDDGVSMVAKFRMRYTSRPATAIGSGQYKFNEGDAFSPGPSNAINDGKFDIRQSGRFHRFRVDMTGAHVMTAYEAIPVPRGRR